MDRPCHAEDFRNEGKKRIGVFGGSFDPVHDGHIYLAKLAYEALDLDEVRFLPCQISPHKTGRPPTPGDVRLQWLKIALSNTPWAKIEILEMEIEGPSFSYQTMEKLTERNPGNHWFWIMGGDQWSALPTWKNPERIAELAEFIVLARNGEKVLPRENFRLHIVPGEHPASSSAIRRALALRESKIPYLHPGIAAMIKHDD